MYVTLYYQPVIYSDQTSTTNSIDLFRTDRFFYTPDFILKRVVGNKTTYAIIDAKWRNRNTLLDKKKEGGMQDLVYKYLYSCSVIVSRIEIQRYEKPKKDASFFTVFLLQPAYFSLARLYSGATKGEKRPDSSPHTALPALSYPHAGR